MTPIVSGAVAESELRALLAPKKNVKRSCDACRRRKGVQYPQYSSSELIDN